MSMRFKTIVLFAIAGALFISGCAGAYMAGRDGATGGPVAAQETGMDRAINVTGEGRVAIVPDTARVVLGVQVEGEDLAELRSEANERMNTVLEGLEADGVPENRIRTVAYDISVMRDWSRDTQPIIGYHISYLVEVKVQPIDEASVIIDNALDNGANFVGSISFDVEDRADAIRQARELAMEDARAKADHLAELGGVNRGAPISITEGQLSTPPIPYQRDLGMGEVAADEDMSVAISPGETEIVVNVSVSYAID
jgi:uncharacterized protein